MDHQLTFLSQSVQWWTKLNSDSEAFREPRLLCDSFYLLYKLIFLHINTQMYSCYNYLIDKLT